MKNKLASLKNRHINRLKAAGFTVVGTAVGAPAFADEATQAAITSAYTDGGADLTVAVAGLIGLVAVVVGVGMIVSMLRKG
tara:strand:- start:163 stop:405 length:243 start_codon:yes stop_codon:yes gene_type:complete